MRRDGRAVRHWPRKPASVGDPAHKGSIPFLSAKISAPMSSADACEVLDQLELGRPLNEIVMPELVAPITEWLEEVRRLDVERNKRLRRRKV